jgi:hypothetical protein
LSDGKRRFTPAILLVEISGLIRPLALDEIRPETYERKVQTLAEKTLAVDVFSDRHV